MVKIGKKIKFFFVQVLPSMFLSYLIPIINVLIIYFLSENKPVNIVWKMNAINIMIATNACYIASISGYLKINEKYNIAMEYIKTIGLIIGTVMFALSTYELQKGIFSINITIYYFSVILTTIFCIVLTIFNKIENKDVNKKLEKDAIEKAKELISKSEKEKTVAIDGQNFSV